MANGNGYTPDYLLGRANAFKQVIKLLEKQRETAEEDIIQFCGSTENWSDAERNTLDAIDACVHEVKDLSANDSWEPCNRCGFDHEYESNHAQLAHAICPLCKWEVENDKIGEGPDHVCDDEIFKMVHGGKDAASWRG